MFMGITMQSFVGIGRSVDFWRSAENPPPQQKIIPLQQKIIPPQRKIIPPSVVSISPQQKMLTLHLRYLR